MTARLRPVRLPLRWLLSLAPLLLLLAGPLGPSASRAEGGSRAAPQSENGRLFRSGAQQVSFAAGYGLGLGLGADRSGDVELTAVIPRWGIVIADGLYEDAWYRGSLSVLAEATWLRALRPNDGSGGNVSLVLRYHFLGLPGRIVPFVEGGSGAGAIDFDLEQQSDGLAFTLLAGVGAHIRMSDRTALTAGWRLHHLSNAGLDPPNAGINDSLFLLGLTYFPR